MSKTRSLLAPILTIIVFAGALLHYSANNVSPVRAQEPVAAITPELRSALDSISEDSLRGIAHKAIARKTGARGLRSIMEAILLEPMFELPSLDGVEAMIINKEVVEGRAKPLYMYTDRRDEATTATRPAS